MNSFMMFQIFLVVHAIAAWTAPIMDCDETFNYWEPLHFMVYSKGLQTWEYSVEYALRSYSYLLLHSGFVYLGQVLLQNQSKLFVFYFVRSMLGAICAFCEVKFVKSISNRFGEDIGNLVLFFLCINSAWFDGSLNISLLFGAMSVCFSWPFSAVMFFPLGFYSIYKTGLLNVVLIALLSVVLFLVIPGIIDSVFYYEKPVIPILNIVLYNVFGQGGDGKGADLYGVEPWHFYLVNLFLNFNILLPLSLLCCIIILGLGSKSPLLRLTTRFELLVFVSGMYITVIGFSSMAHKEERFLTMVYPLICFTAAITLAGGIELTQKVLNFWGMNAKTVSLISRFLLSGAVCLTVVMSLSRSYSLYINFKAPFELYGNFDLQQRSEATNICTSKEWYRFPSNFFLPEKSNIKFLKSHFTGLLPQPFTTFTAKHDHFNDRNEEDDRAYTELSSCDFVVDLELLDDNQKLTDDSSIFASEDFSIVDCVEFLNSGRSKRLFRSFYIPFYVEVFNKYDRYCLLKRIKYSK